ncbi:Leucine-rich repeat domain, L domain-like [Phytophthora cactorum]|nr:Leucine-rich repeat domain, L domain-like [Phytophthora cactorum]
MLECQNCGAVGDSFFSDNYFGEMVCELCGTQSFLQARNETQEAEDMGMDITTVLKTLKRRGVRKKKRSADGAVVEEKRKKRIKKNEHEKTPKLPALLDCVIATQMVLDSMARALIERVGTDTFPADEYPKAVKVLWFKFLKTWGVKGTKPLLRCYNEFFLFYSKEEEKSMDPAATFDLLEQWDAEWEKKKEEEEGKRKKCRKFDELNMFSIVDLVGILVLASRVLNLGLLSSDFAEWVATGVIPYHNSLATCCEDAPDVRDSVKFVVGFFQSLMLRHRATTVQIAYSAHHLQYHMGLRLPPLNVPLAAHRICATMGFPDEVYRNFQWITGFMNVEGEMTELPLMLQAEVDGYPRFKPHLVVAIKMCANWHEWVYERSHKQDEETKEDDEEVRHNAPPVAAVHDAHLLPRRALDSFTRFAKQVFVDPDNSAIPEGLQGHIEQLERIQTTDEPGKVTVKSSSSMICTLLAESDAEIEERMKRLRSREFDGEKKIDAFFYPVFHSSLRTALHPAYEHLSLSTNAIDRLIPLSGMKKLRILSLGRNQIKKIEKLDDVSDTLEELWLSYNVIATLDGLSGLTNLTTLYVSNNLIKSWDELDKLASLPKLRDVLFTGNQFTRIEQGDARLNVLKRIPKVAKIDGDMVKQTERDAALGQ